MTEKKEYEANNITVLEGLEAVRKRPGMYIGSTGIRGLHHMVYEVVDNSIDEAMAGHCNEICVILTNDGKVIVEDNGRGIPVDKHPKFNVSALQVVMTKLHAGGKFDKDTYKVSGGLHGVGVSVVNALSKEMEAYVHKNGQIYYQKYRRGEPLGPVTTVGETDKTGTKIIFDADDEIFDATEYDYDTLAKRMRELAFLNKGIKIIINSEKTKQEDEFCYEGGIKSFIEHLNNGKNVLHDIISFEKEKENVVVDLSLQYYEGFSEKFYSFVNNINTHEGGTHVSGLKTALTRVINNYGERNGILKDLKLSSDDVREGLCCILSLKVPDPQFEGQTKTKLGNSEIKGIVDSIVNSGLYEFFEENPKVAKAILEKAMLSFKAREAARKARDLTRRKSVLENTTLPGKLADCSEKDASKCEIFLVEGDSAGGCFSGDTKISLTDGRKLSFIELIEEDKKGKENFCYTIKKDGSIGVEKILYPRCTKKKAKVIKIILDNDEELICTPDHKFMLRDGKYVQACKLKKDISLMPLYRKNKMILNPKTNLWVPSNLLKTKNFFENDDNAMIEAVMCYNHKIKKIEYLNEKIDVYDIEVPNTHNFALASGVFVHNSAKQGRNREFQAILPLRGKILNVEKARLTKILSSNEIITMITALGCGIGDDFNIEKLRYHKIIIMTDSDVDGAHISTLLLTFFYRYMKPLIEEGHVYIAQPPLYLIKKGNTKRYAQDEDEKNAMIKEFDGMNGVSIQRYKGLGEMNPEQLWNTTMDNENRTLKQIKIEDLIESDNIFSILMGDEVEPRREFIEKNAKYVANLDV